MEIARIQMAERTSADQAAAAQVSRLTTEQKAEQRDLVRAVKAVNASGLMGSDQELTFSMDRESRKVVVRLIDKETHEVLLQIPNEQVLRMAQNLPKS
jgi:flagellar protein FlaG